MSDVKTAAALKDLLRQHAVAVRDQSMFGDSDRDHVERQILALFEEVGQPRGNSDQRVMDPHYDPDAVDGSHSVGGVKPLDKGQRVRLVGFQSWVPEGLRARLGEHSTVFGHDQAHILVDLDEGGSWWLPYTNVVPMEAG